METLPKKENLYTRIRINAILFQDECIYYIRDLGEVRRTNDWREARDYICPRVDTLDYVVETLLDELAVGRIHNIEFERVQ